jgi:hypothetical protein
MLRDMFFTLPGWLMFALGVFLGSYVKSLVGSARSAVGG